MYTFSFPELVFWAAAAEKTNKADAKPRIFHLLNTRYDINFIIGYKCTLKNTSYDLMCEILIYTCSSSNQCSFSEIERYGI